MKELRVGMRVKLVRGSRGSQFGEWIAGAVPVGSKGTIYKAQNGGAAVKFDNVQPQNGCYFGLHSDALYCERSELFEEI